MTDSYLQPCFHGVRYSQAGHRIVMVFRYANSPYQSPRFCY